MRQDTVCLSKSVQLYLDEFVHASESGLHLACDEIGANAKHIDLVAFVVELVDGGDTEIVACNNGEAFKVW
jgi:hypothetical protein